MIDEAAINKLIAPFQCTIINRPIDEFVNYQMWIITIYQSDWCKYQFSITQRGQSNEKEEIIHHKRKAIDYFVSELIKIKLAS